MNLYEYILNSNIRARKNYAVAILKHLANACEPEEKLAFAVLELAILDIGKKPKKDSKGDIIEVLDSRMEWCNGPEKLKFWADVLNIEWGFICKLFDKLKLLEGINPKTKTEWKIAA